MFARRLLVPACLLLAGVLVWVLFSRSGERPARVGAIPSEDSGVASGPSVPDAPATEAAGPTTPPAPASDLDDPARPAAVREGAGSGRVDGKLDSPGNAPLRGRVLLAPRNPRPDQGSFLGDLMSAAMEDPTAWVSMKPPVPERWAPGESDPRGAIRPDGTFSIEAPRKAATYWAVVEADFHYQETIGEVRTDAAGNVKDVVVPVLPGGRLVGRAHGPNAVPLGGAKVRLAPSFDPFSMFAGGTLHAEDLAPRTAESDAAGEWAIGGVRPGRGYSLVVRAKEHGPALLPEIEVVAGRETRLDAALPAERAIVGVVQDDQDRPIAGAKVDALPSGDLSTIMALAGGDDGVRSEEDGSFRLGGLRAGECRVKAEKAGWKESKPLKVIVEADADPPPVVIRLSEGNAVAGRVSDAAGRPVGRVKVHAVFELGAFTMPDPESLAGGAKGSAVSAEDGAFRITGLGKGPFKVSARGESGESASVVGVAAGTKDLELRLRAAGGIAGMVVNEVDGEPVTRFEISLQETAFGMFEVARGRKAFTSDDGAFKLSGLPPGTVTLSVEAKGFAPKKVPGLVVAEGVTTPGVVVSLVPGASVSGRVRAAGTGAPVKGAAVAVGATGMFAMMQSLSGSRRQSTTDADGKFFLDGLAAGDLSLAATHPDFASGKSESMRLEAGAAVRDVEIVLSAGGAVDGYVRDDDGRPVKGAMVMVSTPTASAMRSGQTDAEGYFLVQALNPGTYQVTSMPMRFDNAADPEAMRELMGGMQITSVEVEEGVTVRVLLGGEERTGVRVHGKVLAGGKPVTGAILSATPAGGGKEFRMRSAVSTEDGSYSIEGVRPGANTVTVQRANTGSGSFSMVEISVEVPDATEFAHDLVLATAAVSGRVTDGATGDRLSGIRVSLQREDREEGGMMGGGFFEGQTDPEGRYRFEGVKPGVYTVAAGGPTLFGSNPTGFGRAVRPGVAVEEGAEAKGIDFELRPGGTIAGSVRDAAGRPVEGASVFFRDERGTLVNRFSEIFTDGNGAFRAPGFAAGTYRVFARASGSGLGTVDGVRVRAGEESAATVVLSPGTDLVARVSDADGKPIAGVRATLFDDRGETVSGMLGVSDFVDFFRKGAPGPGEVRVGTFSPGSYRLRVEAAGFRSHEVGVSVSAEPEKTVDVRLER